MILRRITRTLFVLILLITVAAIVFATDGGSLTISKVSAGTILYQVANENGVPVPDFTSVHPEKLSADKLTPELAEDLYDHAVEKNISGQKAELDQDGNVVYSNLPKGYYLVCSDKQEPEFVPFLVSIPLTINDQEVYDIVATPKKDDPEGPFKPADPKPPEPDIPQTGHILWPKYLLLILGAVTIMAGLVEIVVGREKYRD